MDARRYLNRDSQSQLNKDARKKKRAGYVQEDVKRWATLVLGALKWLAVGVVLGAFIWSVPTVWNWLDRPIARVGISGDFRYLNQEQVKVKLGPFLQEQTFFSLDLRGLQKELLADSWIDSVNVRKTWPDQLEITLREEVPVARWRDKELINIEGEVFPRGAGQEFDDFPVLAGPRGREQEVMEQYLTLSHQLRPIGLKLDGVALSPAGSWSFQVDEVEVQLGSEALLERMQRFSRLYRIHLEKQWVAVKGVDLRYRDGVAIAWKQSEQALGSQQALGSS
ncbi:cell division protein FtsQ/DivIB [Sansalvadorimonas sp. 2012CJ34-2]|uniref:Cell division protein FtsQ n=1 Tax=Parendozoicomonas callyspongiae TaxID=2942213 RepID=A0ABT0PC57_9GAMM|nr:cell division protein FtsQ/DivIB [Sansalvadorimonas sp. 2012CJ34-2]MCL6268967.1 cell division protein FtsQ/DivIB [Sansalvadorimonas sp. 2012CJ34-2]